MPYHTNEQDLKLLLKERDFFTNERWEQLKRMQLTTMDALAHACANGDVQQPPDEKKKEDLIKEIEGDWTVPSPVLDENGYPIWDLKEECRAKPTAEIDYDKDYVVREEIPEFPYAL